ncbi:Imm70 family immunity protein [Pseudomonas sp. BF-R-24]|uniref:Imm70 family immunity protein n=1 Tax=Pseudomonas sp. BF-R-24 TaxID=2832386 RepID=UPI001CBE0D90|nr:Imm70 family immunity protein [Pseudomonas sp. BF-R-24]
MTIALKQENVITEIGPGGILHSLCSTIAYRLESGKWGEKYPLIMNGLYQGMLGQKDAGLALAEMQAIKEGLSQLKLDQVIWDIENPLQLPPWGLNVGGDLKNIDSYYVTTSGRNLVNEIIDNLESLKEFGGTLEIISYDGRPPVL